MKPPPSPPLLLKISRNFLEIDFPERPDDDLSSIRYFTQPAAARPIKKKKKKKRKKRKKKIEKSRALASGPSYIVCLSLHTCRSSSPS